MTLYDYLYRNTEAIGFYLLLILVFIFLISMVQSCNKLEYTTINNKACVMAIEYKDGDYNYNKQVLYCEYGENKE